METRKSLGLTENRGIPVGWFAAPCKRTHRRTKRIVVSITHDTSTLALSSFPQSICEVRPTNRSQPRMLSITGKHTQCLLSYLAHHKVQDDGSTTQLIAAALVA